MMSHLSSPPAVINDRYRLVEWLGKGGMGVVYRAQDELLDRSVVIKFLGETGGEAGQAETAEHKARFLREARAVARLSHPNIMAIYDIGQQQGWDYLVLEHIPGLDLHSLQRQRGGLLAVPEALDVAAGVLRALEYAHAQGILHRDIKPENILVTPSGQVKLADFGLALPSGEARLTQEGALVGTALYLAPECLSGAESHAGADLYALGVVLYEALGGRPPFDGDSLVNVIGKVLHGAFEPLRALNPAVPPAVEQVVLRLLAREPRQRYAEAGQVLADMEKLFAPPAQPPAAPEAAGSMLLLGAPGGTGAAVEAERRRLAGLLQTDVLDPLQLLQAQAATFEQTLSAQPTARMAIGVLTALTRQLIQQVHDLEASLHPSVLEALGLEPALEALAEQLERTQGLRLALQVERQAVRLPGEIELALFRLAQEILGALPAVFVTQAELALGGAADSIEMAVTYPTPAGLPEPVLAAARQRLEGLGGRLDIGRQAQGSTRLAMRLPLRGGVAFTPRELEVLQGLVEGLSNKEIARRLSVSPRTVNYHLDNIYAKLGVNTRTEAALIALRQGWARRPSQGQR